MYVSNLEFWLKETTEFPIDDFGKTLNYLTEFYGTVVLGERAVNRLVSESCLDSLISAGKIIKHSNNTYYFGG